MNDWLADRKVEITSRVCGQPIRDHRVRSGDRPCPNFLVKVIDGRDIDGTVYRALVCPGCDGVTPT